METNQKLTFITLWRLEDWGFYNRRNEALLRELSLRDKVESVLHVEHVSFKGVIYRILQWIKAKDKLLRGVYGVHIKKGFSLKPILVKNEKKYYVYSVVKLYYGDNPFLRMLSDLFLNIQYHSINKHFGKSKRHVVLVAYPPSKYLLSAIKKIEHDILIADFEDDTAERAQDEIRKTQIIENYKEVLPKCRWIFSTSPIINEKYKDCAKQEIDFLSNGVDIHLFSTKSRNDGFKKGERKVAGYVGVINREVDVDLLEYILTCYPEVDFILIGYATEERLNDIKNLNHNNHNLVYLGERCYSEIPDDISKCDVLMNIKKNDRSTAGGESQKIYEYLATGKPVVTTPVPPADRLTDLMYVASDKYQFAEFLKKALEEDDAEIREKRIKAAMDNSWAKRVDVILYKVSELL
jgi:glycosyltransferase involved in cell wall biosynthesis